LCEFFSSFSLFEKQIEPAIRVMKMRLRKQAFCWRSRRFLQRWRRREKKTHTHTHTVAQERPQKRCRDGKRRKPYSRVRISRPKVLYRLCTYNVTYEWSYVLYVFWWGGGVLNTQLPMFPSVCLCLYLSVDLKNWKLKIKGLFGICF
jgi:hypothetical protein